MWFEGKACIVTGATSGIGLAIAEDMARHGASLLLTGRNEERGAALAKRLRETGSHVVFSAADLADRKAGDRLAALAVEHFGRIDVLVNNAGLLINGAVAEHSDDDWDRIMDINLSAAFRLSRAVLPAMLGQKSGSIVNVASDWALMGAKGAVAYCVSKAALAQLTRCMALDHAKDGIRVNAICPTDTETPMLDLAFPGLGHAESRQALAATIPMGRVARVDEVARVVSFLASDQASFMTGSLVPIDGGTSAQ